MRRALDVIHGFLKSRYFYPAAFVGCLVPAVLLLARVYRAVYQGDLEALGANPVETLMHETGEDALGILLLTLCITPLRRLTGWNRLQRIRRMVGVWSFVYALSHFSIYVAFDQLGDPAAIWDDVIKRKFIFAGMLAFSLLLVLAVTSTNGMIRRLRRNWQKLHRIVYLAATAGVVHFVWGQKADIAEPLRWAVWLAALLGIRVYFAMRKRRPGARERAAA
jgi:methionine sulfoxide reductase heme-binding subunit